MIGVRVEGATQTAARIAWLAPALQSAMLDGLREVGRRTHNRMKQQLTAAKVRDPFWGVRGGAASTLVARSGALRRSLTPGTNVFRLGESFAVVVGSPLPYAKLHEEGGTIGPALIPTAAAQTQGGDTRFPLGPRQVPGGFVWPTAKMLAGGKMKRVPKYKWIATTAAGPWSRGRGRGASDLVLMYMLKESVKIRARKPFGTVADELRGQIGEIMAGKVSVTVEREMSRG